jgi:hypothetical protein
MYMVCASRDCVSISVVSAIRSASPCTFTNTDKLVIPIFTDIAVVTDCIFNCTCIVFVVALLISYPIAWGASVPGQGLSSQGPTCEAGHVLGLVKSVLIVKIDDFESNKYEEC